MSTAMDSLTREERDEVYRQRTRDHFAPPLCDVCGSPTHGEERLLPGESGGRVAHQLCYWRQRALAGEAKGR